MKQIPDIIHKPDQKRLIISQLMVQRIHGLLFRRHPQDLSAGIPGREIHNGKHDEQHSQQGRNNQKQPFNYVLTHTTFSFVSLEIYKYAYAA